MDYRVYITAAVKDVMIAEGISVHDRNRYNAMTARTTYALTALFRQAALRGVEQQVIDGFFKLSANELHRLPQLVSSIIECRLPAVGRALIDYNDNH